MWKLGLKRRWCVKSTAEANMAGRRPPPAEHVRHQHKGAEMGPAAGPARSGASTQTPSYDFLF
jgi:hypothetical protein